MNGAKIISILFAIGFYFQPTLASSSPLAAKLDSSEILESVIEKARILKLGQKVGWKRLLHFQTNTLGQNVSQVESDNFFLSERGRFDSQLELEATMKILLDSGNGRCRFPARKKWLQRELDLELEPPNSSPCSEYDRFREIVRAKSVSLIFSSAYLNNPASAYGHTFLRLNQSDSVTHHKFELTDYAVNFSAMVESSNPLSYSLQGALGFLPGQFEIKPYFFKVREYNDFESRDLWEYSLPLNSDQVDTLIRHLWELQNVRFGYFYFKQNCSYQMLALLEVADSNSRLLAQLKPYVLPSETLSIAQNMPNPHHISLPAPKLRPSHRRHFQKRWQSLSLTEKAQTEKLIASVLSDEFFDQSQVIEEAKIIDTALDFVEYKYAKEILISQGQWIPRKQLLLARAKLSFLPEKNPEVELSPPHESEPPGMLGFGGESRKYSSTNDLRTSTLAEKWNPTFQVRFVLHEFLDPSESVLTQAEIKMVDLHWFLSSFDNESIPQLDRVVFLKIASRPFGHPLTSPISWFLNWDTFRSFDPDCSSGCFQNRFQLGAGQTWGLGGISNETYLSSLTAMLINEISYSERFGENIQSSPFRQFLGPNLRLEIKRRHRNPASESFLPQSILSGSILGAFYFEYFRRFYWPWKWTHQFNPPLHQPFETIEAGFQLEILRDFPLRLSYSKKSHLSTVYEETLEAQLIRYF